MPSTATPTALTDRAPLHSPSVRMSALRPRRLTPVEDASVWDASSFASMDGWLRHLDATHLQEIDSAIRSLRAKGRTLATVQREDFVMPTLTRMLQDMLHTDLAQRGFSMIRGFPVDQYSDEEKEMFFWAVGLCMGKGVSQNAEGHRLGHVRSQGLDYDKLNVRGYQTQAHLPFHCDPSDVVGLFCMAAAKSGGLSSVISGMAMYNAVLREHPEYLDLLYRGFRYDRRGEETEYQGPISDYVPVFSQCEGQLSIRYVRKSMETAQQKLGKPFTPEELEVLDYMEELSQRPELIYAMMLEPGDMQFCNNYLVLHSRTAYEEAEPPAPKRHLLRLWIKAKGIRKLTPECIEFDPVSGWSRREGIPARGAPAPIHEPDFSVA
jgi:hypothetical protein